MLSAKCHCLPHIPGADSAGPQPNQAIKHMCNTDSLTSSFGSKEIKASISSKKRCWAIS